MIKIIIRWSANGTHKGELMGVSPIGLPVSTMGITINRIAGGKVVDEWSTWDALSMWQQLGMELKPQKDEK